MPTGSANLGLDEFRGDLVAMSPDRIRVTMVHWLTRFSVHHRRVDRYREGSLMLAGDAEHIHSPGARA